MVNDRSSGAGAVQPAGAEALGTAPALNTQACVLALLDAYAPADAMEAALLAEFRRFVGLEPHCCERTLAFGHLTGAAWLVSADGGRVLLTHHRKLERWLQLGGHADGDPDLARVALREAGEESGLPGLALDPGIFDLDRHWIPARGAEPGHWHYDVRFVVRASGSEQFVVGEESHDLAWRDIGEVARDESVDTSVRRMARKWLARRRVE
jgi:8-oxo-dGTP pyrophosphatase MutT (NUDIX family)